MENTMKLNIHIKLRLLLGWMIANATGLAQVGGNYRLSWNTLDGAGATCANGDFVLCGTVGQPDASAASIGGAYTMSSGFWTEAATEVRPRLHIASSGGSIIIAWPASATGFHLEHCTDLARSPWVSNTTPVFTFGEDKVAVEPANGVRFYRLAKP